MATQQLSDAERLRQSREPQRQTPDNVAPAALIRQFQPLSLLDVLWNILPPDRLHTPFLSCWAGGCSPGRISLPEHDVSFQRYLLAGSPYNSPIPEHIAGLSQLGEGRD